MKKLIFCFLIASFGAFCQNSVILESYVQEGLRSNLSLKQQDFELKKAVQNIELAKVMFSPRLTFAPTYSLAGGGRRLSFPVGDLLNPVYSTLNQLTKSNAFPQIENVDEQLAPNNFQDTKLSFSYPLFNTDIQYNYLIQKQMLGVEEAKKRVLENEIRYYITGAYLQYLQTLEANKIFEHSRKVLQDFVRLNQKLVANNVATKDVIYAAEYEVSKLDQQKATNEKNRETAKTYFNFLLNKDLFSDIQADTLLIDKAKPLQNPRSNFIENSLSNRQEISQLNAHLQVSESAIKLQEMDRKYPQIMVGGNAGFQGYGYKFSGQAYYVAQIGLTYDLFHGYEKKQKMQAAKIQKEQIEGKLEELRQQISLQVARAYIEAEASQKNIVTTRDATLKAEKYFAVIASKYHNGQALLMEYTKAHNDVLTAKLSESLAKYDILVKQAELDKAAAIR